MSQMAITSSGDDVINFQDDVKDFETELERINGVANVNYAGGLTVDTTSFLTFSPSIINIG